MFTDLDKRNVHVLGPILPTPVASFSGSRLNFKIQLQMNGYLSLPTYLQDTLSWQPQPLFSIMTISRKLMWMYVYIFFYIILFFHLDLNTFCIFDFRFLLTKKLPKKLLATFTGTPTLTQWGNSTFFLNLVSLKS